MDWCPEGPVLAAGDAAGDALRGEGGFRESRAQIISAGALAVTAPGPDAPAPDAPVQGVRAGGREARRRARLENAGERDGPRAVVGGAYKPLGDQDVEKIHRAA